MFWKKNVEIQKKNVDGVEIILIIFGYIIVNGKKLVNFQKEDIVVLLKKYVLLIENVIKENIIVDLKDMLFQEKKFKNVIGNLLAYMEKEKRCCTFIKRCIGRKNCVEKLSVKTPCVWVGFKILSKRSRKCTWKRYGIYNKKKKLL